MALKTESPGLLIAEMPQTQFLSKLKRYFSFMEFLSKNTEDSCLVLIIYNTMHMDTLPSGIKGYIKIPITTVKPSHFETFDLNTLFQLVVHTYHPKKTEPNIVQNQNMKQLHNFFEANYINLYKDPILDIYVFNVQLSQKLAPVQFDLYHNLKKFHFSKF